MRLRVEASIIVDGKERRASEFRVVPDPADAVLAQLIVRTDVWSATGVLSPDQSRVDLLDASCRA